MPVVNLTPDASIKYPRKVFVPREFILNLLVTPGNEILVAVAQLLGIRGHLGIPNDPSLGTLILKSA
jgi:hypothetical protein